MPPGEDGQETDEERAAREAAEAEAARVAAAGGGDNDDDDDFDKPRALNTIRTLRDETKRERTARLAAEKRLKEIEDQGKSELERVTAERDDLKTRNAQHEQAAKDRVTRDAFAAAAEKANALKPEALYKLAEGLNIDDDGKPTNAVSVIKDLKEAYPELFAASNVDGNAGRGRGVKGQSMNDLIRASRGRGGR